jgi:hypothetical protein
VVEKGLIATVTNKAAEYVMRTVAQFSRRGAGHFHQSRMESTNYLAQETTPCGFVTEEATAEAY